MRSPSATILSIATGEPAKKMNSPSFTGGAPVMVERATTTGSVPSVITGLKKSEKLPTGEVVVMSANSVAAGEPAKKMKRPCPVWLACVEGGGKGAAWVELVGGAP